MNTQMNQMLEYMEAHRDFSALEVTRELGFGDIRKKISVFRKRGHNITDEWTVSPKGIRYKIYHYEGVA